MGRGCVRGRICVWIRPTDTQLGRRDLCDDVYRSVNPGFEILGKEVEFEYS